MMARYLVTGGGGFIGSNLVEAILRLGDTVRVLDDFSTGSRRNLDFSRDRELAAAAGDRLDIVEGDLRSAGAVARACEGVDFVLHHGAVASVPRSFEDPIGSHRVNLEGTLNVLEAARAAGVRRVVYASSSSVYGDDPELPKRETMATMPLSPYAATKAAAETYCRIYHHAFGLETVSLRYFNIFGPRQDPHSPYAAVIPSFIRALLRGQPPTIYGDGRQSRDFTFIDNAVRANLDACGAPAAAAAGNVFNIAGGDRHDLLWLADTLGGILGRRIEPVHEDPRTGEVRHSGADISRAREAIGYDPRVSIEEGLSRTVDWFRQFLS